MNILNLSDEELAMKVHNVYCVQYELNHGKPYWTNGDYKKLEPSIQAYDLNLVKFIRECVRDSSSVQARDAYLTALLKPLREAKDYADKWKDTAVGFRALADAVSKLLEES